MTESKILGFRCPNKECAHPIRMKDPGKAGIYKIECPACKHTFRINIPEKQAQAATPVRLPDAYLAGESYTVSCPHCQKVQMRFTPQNAGEESLVCPRCKGKILLTVKAPTAPVYMTEPMASKGKLQLLRKGWLNKDFPLNVGVHTIGRADADCPSDISVKNDPCMSRRSVSIEVKKADKGYTFRLTVLKATNPVLHNNKPLTEGESISLNYGDSIILGETKFRFIKA